jgi:hypothetical protein
MRHSVRAVSVELDGALISPGDLVLVHNERYKGAAGRFHGKFGNGKLAVTVNDRAFCWTYLHLLPTQVKLLPKGATRT